MSASDPARPRIIFNDDGSNFLYAWDDLGADDLRTYLSYLDDTHVDMVAWCVAFGGYVTYYESRVAERIGTGFLVTDRVKQRRWAHNRERLAREAGDYCGFVFDTLREMGIAPLASFRMNDAHMSSDPVGPVAGRFWMNHPEWRIGEPFGYYRSCLDYAQPAVREYLRKLVMEAVEKFPDIAGIELDAMRSPFFFRDGQGRANAPVMTEFMRTVRGDLDEAAERMGRDRYYLRVNVPRSPELALECGLDVGAWDGDELVDGISPGCYPTDYRVPIEAWKSLLGDRTAVHSYVNCSPGTGQYHSVEEYRGAAANAYGAGADGVYLFNVPCQMTELPGLIPRPVDQPPFPPPEFREQCWHPDITRVPQVLSELGDPGLLAGLDKCFLFHVEDQSYRHYPPEPDSIDRHGAHTIEVPWRCYEDYGGAEEIAIEVKLVAVTIRDEFELAVNGEPPASERVERLHAPTGRDERVHWRKLEPYSLYRIDATGLPLQHGDNTLTVTLTEQEPDLFGQIKVRDLEVTVRYG